jgi:hypothetical protein
MADCDRLHALDAWAPKGSRSALQRQSWWPPAGTYYLRQCSLSFPIFVLDWIPEFCSNCCKIGRSFSEFRGFDTCQLHRSDQAGHDRQGPCGF